MYSFENSSTADTLVFHLDFFIIITDAHRCCFKVSKPRFISIQSLIDWWCETPEVRTCCCNEIDFQQVSKSGFQNWFPNQVSKTGLQNRLWWSYYTVVMSTNACSPKVIEFF